MKRIFALFLCLMMCMALVPAATAEEIIIMGADEPDETEIITLVDTEETVAVNPGEGLLASKPTITTQPSSITAYVDTTTRFTVKADGATSYQWQCRTSESGSWNNSTLSTAKEATLKVKASIGRNGYQYRCAVKNASGTTYSNAATLTVSQKPVITTQPKSVSIGEGKTATFTVKADGATSYQWQYRKTPDGSWKNSAMSSSTTATLSIPATMARNGIQFRCVIKNSSGTTKTNVVTLTVISLPTITTQPLSCTASVGTSVIFAVKASGATSYQWQYRKTSDSSWTNSVMSSSKTDTLSISATTARDGILFRCKVSNAGGSVYSETVTLNAISKKCGDNLSWTLDDAGKLSITGTGKMYHFNWDDPAPWLLADQTVKTAVIGDSVTRIGACAFENIDTLTSITIGSGVTIIGDYAFQYCSALTSLKIPASVTVIGEAPFSYCSSLQSITVVSGNSKFSSSGGVLFNKDKTVLLTYPAGKSGAYTIPSTVKTIGECAFDTAEKLSAVTIPEGVVTIKNYAFSSCAVLPSISIPASVTSIGPYAFDESQCLTSITVASGNQNYSSKNGVLYNKGKTSLLRFPEGKTGSFTVPSTVKTIGNSAFFGCGNLSGVTLPEGVTSVDEYAFYGCCALTSVTIPNTVQSIGDYAFCYCDHLKKVTIGTGVTAINDGAFCDCEQLTDVYYKGSKTQWNKIEVGGENDPLLNASFHYNA